MIKTGSTIYGNLFHSLLLGLSIPWCFSKRFNRFVSFLNAFVFSFAFWSIFLIASSKPFNFAFVCPQVLDIEVGAPQHGQFDCTYSQIRSVHLPWTSQGSTGPLKPSKTSTISPGSFHYKRHPQANRGRQGGAWLKGCQVLPEVFLMLFIDERASHNIVWWMKKKKSRPSDKY